MSEEQRQHPRLKANLMVDFTTEEGRVFLYCQIIDVAQGGAFVHTTTDLDIGTKLDLKVRVPLDETKRFKNVIIKGEVVRTGNLVDMRDRERPGLGIKFSELSESDWAFILKVITRTLKHKTNVPRPLSRSGSRLEMPEERKEPDPFAPPPSETDEAYDDRFSSSNESRIYIDDGNRNQERIEKEIMARVQSQEGDFIVNVHNVNKNGIGFSSNKSLLEETELLITLELPSHTPINLNGRVVWRKLNDRVDMETFHYGVELSGNPADYSRFIEELFNERDLAPL